MSAEHRARANGRGDDPSEPPSDLELMLFFDGELDEPRRAEVERHLAHADGAAARGKLGGLEALSLVVRENAGIASKDFSIADAVMAALPSSSSSDAGGTTQVAGLAGVVERGAVGANAASGPPRREPANDNSKRILRLAVAAVAAAAGLMIWSRGEVPRADSGAQAIALRSSAPVVAQAPSVDTAAPAPDDGEAEGEAEVGVVVAAVDFGSQHGSVFYVPGGPSVAASTTTVVWIAENGVGGEQ